MYRMEIMCSDGWTPTDKFCDICAGDMANLLQYGVGIPGMCGCGTCFRISTSTMLNRMGDIETRGEYMEMSPFYPSIPLREFLIDFKELFDLADKSNGFFVFRILDVDAL